jgi:hypothetical protein
VPDLDSALVRKIPDSANLRLLTARLDVTMRQTALDRDAARTASWMAIDLLHSAIARSRGDASDSREIILLRVKAHRRVGHRRGVRLRRYADRRVYRAPQARPGNR